MWCILNYYIPIILPTAEIFVRAGMTNNKCKCTRHFDSFFKKKFFNCIVKNFSICDRSRYAPMISKNCSYILHKHIYTILRRKNIDKNRRIFEKCYFSNFRWGLWRRDLGYPLWIKLSVGIRLSGRFGPIPFRPIYISAHFWVGRNGRTFRPKTFRPTF